MIKPKRPSTDEKISMTKILTNLNFLLVRFLRYVPFLGSLVKLF